MKKSLILCLVLAGCGAPIEFRQADGSAPDPQRLAADRAVCREQARAAQPSNADVYAGGAQGPTDKVDEARGNFVREFYARDFVEACMKEKGYMAKAVVVP